MVSVVNMRHATGSGWVAIRKPGPHSEVMSSKWFRFEEDEFIYIYIIFFFKKWISRYMCVCVWGGGGDLCVRQPLR